MAFADTIAAINSLRTEGLIRDYAITGAVAQAFWDEAIPTFDLDVLVLLGPVENRLAPLSAIYEWAREREYVADKEHIVIAGVPVQFLPAPDALSEEAIQAASDREIGGVPLRVVRPEYLIALWLQPPANTHRRKERAAKLRECGQVDEAHLGELMTRYGLSW